MEVSNETGLPHVVTAKNTTTKPQPVLEKPPERGAAWGPAGPDTCNTPVSGQQMQSGNLSWSEGDKRPLAATRDSPTLKTQTEKDLVPTDRCAGVGSWTRG